MMVTPSGVTKQMVDCPANSSLGVCDVLNEAGTGLGIFMEAIRSPLVKFLAVIAIVGAVVLLIVGIAKGIRGIVSRKL